MPASSTANCRPSGFRLVSTTRDDQGAGVPDDRAARLEHDRHAQPPQLGQHRRRVLRRRDHRPAFVGDAEAAAEIHVLEREAVLVQLQRQRRPARPRRAAAAPPW